MNVLSLFDGMSCGQQALERAGFKIDNYFASEIDKYAIQVTMANYPKTIQLGSVVDIDGCELPKIDLLIGGSPCQSFSFAGKCKGMSTKDEQEILTLSHYLELKKEGYEFEGQSYLFWEYMRLLNELRQKNPKVCFLLENVEMGEKWEKVLSKAIGVNGIHINSALVSAQNRKRIYWTNIGMRPAGLFGYMQSIIEQPKDKGILLKDILEIDVDKRYYLNDKSFIFNRIENNHPFTPRIPNEEQKSNCLKVGGSGVDDLIIANGCKEQVVGRKAQLDGTYKREYEVSKDEKSKTLETNKHKNNVSISKIDILNENQQKKFNNDVDTEKHNTLTLAISKAGSSSEYMSSVSKIAKLTSKIRKLTPIECERLQTVPDNYTNYVSDSQRYKMLGNGWTIDVISHIFSYLDFPKQ